MGMVPGIKAFVAAVFGGIGILPGAMFGVLFYWYCGNDGDSLWKLFI